MQIYLEINTVPFFIKSYNKKSLGVGRRNRLSVFFHVEDDICLRTQATA